MGARRGVAVGALVAVVGLALAVTLAVTSAVDDVSGGLTLPEPGEVSAGWIDGHPVFVTHDHDGAVRVLDAVSPAGRIRKVLVWCRSSGRFEDLWNGAEFRADGTWVSGPAPTGMAAYTDVHVSGDRVRAGAPGPPRRRDAVPREVGAVGPGCDERTALYLPNHPADPAVLDDLTIHDTAGGDVAGLLYATPARILGEAPRGG